MKNDLCFWSSRWELFCKKGVFKNFAKFKGNHLYKIFFFNKVAGLRPANLVKKRQWHRCFPVNFAKILRTPVFIVHLWLLLLAHLVAARLWLLSINSLSNLKTFKRRMQKLIKKNWFEFIFFILNSIKNIDYFIQMDISFCKSEGYLFIYERDYKHFKDIVLNNA